MYRWEGWERTYDLGKTVDRACVHPLTLVRRVLHLQSGFYVLDRPRDEGYGPAGHDAGEGVAHDGEFLLGLRGEARGVEDVVVEDAAVDAEGAEHAADMLSYRCGFGLGLDTYIESMNIHPTSGGVAPLYIPFTPSFFSVCVRQSMGPRKCVASVVWSRTLMVSNGCPTAGSCISFLYSAHTRGATYQIASQCPRKHLQRSPCSSCVVSQVYSARGRRRARRGSGSSSRQT